MTTPEYIKCPASDPLSRAFPEIFTCPKCGGAIEIWTDEVGEKCLSCNTFFRKIQVMDISDHAPDVLPEKDVKIGELIKYAQKLGATQTAIVATKNITVDNDLAERCRVPRCENYNLSKSCPPHVSGPVRFEKMLVDYRYALFFTISVPFEVFHSSERREIYQLLHEVAAQSEHYAINLGFEKARAYAGGSCKKIFCNEYATCLALSDEGECRNPQSARPSMSGYGIHVANLIKIAGWDLDKETTNKFSTDSKSANVYGLVIIY